MKYFLLILLLCLPAFVQMLRFGLYTTHDFHFFRQYEFDKCISDHVFPCRWSANAGMGYGEPVFNFYGQLPYVFGQIFKYLGFSVIDSVKTVFILSLVLSSVFMYLLSRRFWGHLGGLISALFYVFAPYRAIDVWVRGALPESLAFVFFPLILLSLEKYLHRPRLLPLLEFSLSWAGLVLVHNLSAFMFFPFVIIWWLWRSRQSRGIMSGIPLLAAFIFSLFLSAFYLLPVIFESRLTTVNDTTRIYYEYGLHFTSLKQLFVSRFWGYGGSVWGLNDTMSFSAGHLHWILAVIIGLYLLMKRQIKSPLTNNYLLFTGLGIFALFLTHGKSDFIWRLVPYIRFVQFPWRFLTITALFLALASGSIARILPNKFIPYILLLLLLTNFMFFRPDIWRPISDSVQFSGVLWDEQRASSLQDYWPKSAPLKPREFAPSLPEFTTGQGQVAAFHKSSHSAQAQITVSSPRAEVLFPIVYFPGWTAQISGRRFRVIPSGDLGRITVLLPAGSYLVQLRFTDTPVRRIGNLVSLVSGILLLSALLIIKKPSYAKS